jgi:hypothetical protein
MLILRLDSLMTLGLNKHPPKYQGRHTAAVNRHSLQGMNQTLVSVAVAMIVPAVAVICVVILERRHVPEEPITPEIVLMIPTLTKSPVLVVTRRRWRWP